MAFAADCCCLGTTSISGCYQLPSLAILITSVPQHQSQFKEVLQDMAPAVSFAQGSFHSLMDCIQVMQRLFSC